MRKNDVCFQEMYPLFCESFGESGLQANEDKVPRKVF